MKFHRFILCDGLARRRTSHEVRGLKSPGAHRPQFKKVRRTSHEVRGLKSDDDAAVVDKACSRTSHEVRGLKLEKQRKQAVVRWSHLTRGAWIEMAEQRLDALIALCRTSHEVRGLKLMTLKTKLKKMVVAPHTRCVD